MSRAQRFRLIYVLMLGACSKSADETLLAETASPTPTIAAPAPMSSAGRVAEPSSGSPAVRTSQAAGTAATPAAVSGGAPGRPPTVPMSGIGSMTSGGAGTSAAGSGGSGVEAATHGDVEDSGADCEAPELPLPDELPVYEKHHDPFTMLDGARVTQKAQWRCRRAEIKAQVERYESGPKPVVSREDVSAQLAGNKLTISVAAEGKSVRFAVDIKRPEMGSAAAAPLVIAYKFETLDSTVFAENGVASLIYDNDAMGAESGAGSRGTGTFYELYGRDHPASSMVAWAWGVSRIIDAIEKTPELMIDPRKIAVTGCSRYGKGALLAGAFDERIVLTIPQESGAGGSASWRVSQAQSELGENVQTLSSAANEQPWFRADFAQNFGGKSVTKLPFDHHMVMGLVAPRALLVLDNRVDWLGIDSSFTAGSIAHTIWAAFGAPDHMGYWQTEGHTHCEFPAAQRTILEAYVGKFLVGGGSADTAILRADHATADLASWQNWEAPTLQ